MGQRIVIRGVAPSYYVKQLAVTQTFGQALQVANGIIAVDATNPDDGSNPYDEKLGLLALIAGHQAEAGAIEEARQTAQGISKAARQDVAWFKIAEAQADRGDVDVAKQTSSLIQNEFYKGEAIAKVGRHRRMRRTRTALRHVLPIDKPRSVPTDTD